MFAIRRESSIISLLPLVFPWSSDKLCSSFSASSKVTKKMEVLRRVWRLNKRRNLITKNYLHTYWRFLKISLNTITNNINKILFINVPSHKIVHNYKCDFPTNISAKIKLIIKLIIKIKTIFPISNILIRKNKLIT